MFKLASALYEMARPVRGPLSTVLSRPVFRSRLSSLFLFGDCETASHDNPTWMAHASFGVRAIRFQGNYTVREVV